MAYLTRLDASKNLHLGKSFQLVDGEVERTDTGSNMSPAKGKAYKLNLNARQLVTELQNTPAYSAYLLGEFDADIQQVCKDGEQNDTQKARCNADMHYHNGSCWSVVDMGDIDKHKFEWWVANTKDQLEQIAPGISNCQLVLTASSSSRMIINGERKPGGCHVWIQFATLKDKLQFEYNLVHYSHINKLFFYKLSNPSNLATTKTSQLLRYTLFDNAIYQVSRLIFETDPKLDGIKKSTGNVVLLDGDEEFYRPPSIKRDETVLALLPELTEEQVEVLKKRCELFTSRAKSKAESEWLKDEFYSKNSFEIAYADDKFFHAKTKVNISVKDILAGDYEGDRFWYEDGKEHGSPSIECSKSEDGTYRLHDHAINKTIYLQKQTRNQRLILSKYLSWRGPKSKDGTGSADIYKLYSFVAYELGIPVAEVQFVIDNYITEIALTTLRRAVKPNRTFKTPALATEYLADKSGFYLILGDCGSGKTTEIARPLIKQAKYQNKNVISLSPTTALTESSSLTFGVASQTDTEIADATQELSCTINCFADATKDSHKRKHKNVMRLLSNIGQIHIDEINTCLNIIGHDRSYIKESSGVSFYEKLRSVPKSTLICGYDQDADPNVAALVHELGGEVIEIESPYPNPKYSFNLEGFKNSEKFFFKDLLEGIRSGAHIAVGCDSIITTKTISRKLKELGIDHTVLNRETKEEHVDFLADPNGEAFKHKVMIYSPVIGTGVSITSISPKLFLYLTGGTLRATNIVQLARRYRMPEGSVVNVYASGMYQTRCRMKHPSYVARVNKVKRGFILAAEADQIYDDVSEALDQIEASTRYSFENSLDMLYGYFLATGTAFTINSLLMPPDLRSTGNLYYDAYDPKEHPEYKLPSMRAIKMQEAKEIGQAPAGEVVEAYRQDKELANVRYSGTKEGKRSLEHIQINEFMGADIEAPIDHELVYKVRQQKILEKLPTFHYLQSVKRGEIPARYGSGSIAYNNAMFWLAIMGEVMSRKPTTGKEVIPIVEAIKQYSAILPSWLSLPAKVSDRNAISWLDRVLGYGLLEREKSRINKQRSFTIVYNEFLTNVQHEPEVLKLAIDSGFYNNGMMIDAPLITNGEKVQMRMVNKNGSMSEKEWLTKAEKEREQKVLELEEKVKKLEKENVLLTSAVELKTVQPPAEVVFNARGDEWVAMVDSVVEMRRLIRHCEKFDNYRYQALVAVLKEEIAKRLNFEISEAELHDEYIRYLQVEGWLFEEVFPGTARKAK